MRVGAEKKPDSYKSIVKDANKAIKGKTTVKKSQYEKALSSREVNVEQKKNKLAKALHELILHSLSANIQKKSNKKSALSRIKKHAALIRQTIRKIKDINNYLEESLLKDIGIIKKPMIMKALKSKSPRKFLQSKRGLPKGYIKNIEHTVYKLMQEIIFFDETLIKRYSKKEAKAAKKEKAEVKYIENILRTETELLDALEAKIPPAKKIKERLFTRQNYNNWVPYVFALLASFEAEHEKERLIFSKLKKNSKSRKKIEAKIKHIVKEKEKMLMIKEKRALSMEKLGKIQDDHRHAFHEYVHATSL